MLKILLTHAYFLNEDPKEQEIMKPYVPLGILYISAYLEQKNIAHQVIDTTFSDFEKFKAQLLESKPDVVAIYTNLMTKINVLRTLAWIASETSLSHTRIVLGGPEVRHHAEAFLRKGADCIVIGEGEETFYELLSHYQNTSIPKQNISGLAFLNEQGDLQWSPERTLIKEIHTLPMPNRKSIDLHLYGEAWKRKHGYSMYSISTMRGCPYTCKWCSRAVYGGSYRRRKPEQVAEEMIYLKTHYQPDRLWFVDDVFTISHKWLQAFAEEVKKQNAFIPYEIITRADRLNTEVLHWLKESGCFRIWIGAESGSQKIIDAMDRRVEVRQVREMIQQTRALGMEAGTFIMLGYPGEDTDDIRETITHLIQSEPDQFTITIAYPIKGTPLYEETEAMFYGNLDWDTQTDRDQDFKRKHPRKFYEYAVRWVYNEVNLHRKRKSNAPLPELAKLRLKALLARGGMWWNR